MEYINKDVWRRLALSGAIFLAECESTGFFMDPYNLIYGHHMSNGAMFGDVVEFADEEYFATHETEPYICRKNMFHYIFCLCGDRCDAQPDLWIYRGNRIRPGSMQQLLQRFRNMRCSIGTLV